MLASDSPDRGRSESSQAHLVKLFQRASIPGMRSSEAVRAFVEEGAVLRWSDLNPDSLSLMALCIEIENEFGLSISPGELLELDTVNQLVDLLSLEA